MSTILYPSPIFGPIHSRRLGVSLGINLLPADGKVCTFDCIYCECGLNGEHRPTLPMPSREEVRTALERRLQDMAANGPSPDVLTFAGNGEPTCHPDFASIIADTIELRNRYFPCAKVSVLSNATQIHRQTVREALMTIDNNILKLDTLLPDATMAIDRPTGHYATDRIVDDMQKFDGHVIIQTIYFHRDNEPDDTQPAIDQYIDTLRIVRPQQVMLYTIDRETPTPGLTKATHEELDSIADEIRKAGFDCQVSY